MLEFSENSRNTHRENHTLFYLNTEIKKPKMLLDRDGKLSYFINIKKMPLQNERFSSEHSSGFTRQSTQGCYRHSTAKSYFSVSYLPTGIIDTHTVVKGNNSHRKHYLFSFLETHTIFLACGIFTKNMIIQSLSV